MNRVVVFFILLLKFILAQNDVCFNIESNPNLDDPAFDCFSKYVNVLNCFEVYAESNISDHKVLHVASIAAELLDNNEDGIIDDENLYIQLQSKRALIPIFTFDGSSCMDNFTDFYDGDGVSAVLWRNEIEPSEPGHWGSDATVEEVLHTINHVGHVALFPEAFNIIPNSSIMSDAMDIARGGQFINVPNSYPEESWYHYDDWTCDYECQAIEYFYWSIVSYMGILDDPQTCSGIYNEWELCTPELFQNTDILMYSIITDNEYKLPLLAPDGNYCPSSADGDLNFDDIVNVLDVIIVVNYILNMQYNNLADLNQDNFVDVLDVVLISNIILG